MIEIRFHGSGGHGAVVASKFLADAAARSGYQSQSFASYGALRRGGKVEAYARIAEHRVTLHCKMYEPDYLVIMDERYTEDPDVIEGLKHSGRILINSARPPAHFSGLKAASVTTIDAYAIAAERGLSLPGGMPVINTTLLGSLVAILPQVRLEALLEVIRTGIPKPEENVQSAKEGYRRVSVGLSGAPAQAGNAAAQQAGERIPVYDTGRMGNCGHCMICYISCPSLAIRFSPDPFTLMVDPRFCTACGICIHECPRKALSWREANHG